MTNEEINLLFAELKELLSDMDIPDYRKTSVQWLSKNLAARNSKNVNFTKADEIVKKLRAAGINSEPT